MREEQKSYFSGPLKWRQKDEGSSAGIYVGFSEHYKQIVAKIQRMQKGIGEFKFITSAARHQVRFLLSSLKAKFAFPRSST